MVPETVLAALEEADALAPGEVPAAVLRAAAADLDPGEPVDHYLALAALSWAVGEGVVPRPVRLTFVPGHVEYDAGLLADITASLLTSLGQAVRPDEVRVAIAGDRAEVSFPVAGQWVGVQCEYLPKYPPADLPPALERVVGLASGRELVCADDGYQMLVYASIRAGGLAALNERLGHETPLFTPA